MGKPVRRFFCVQRGVVKRDAPQGVAKTPYPLPFRPPVTGLVPFLPGQLVGSLAEPFHGFQFLPHGLHVDAVHLLLGGQQVNLAPPFLRGDFFAAGFQFLQIPGRRVIEDQFPAVALLEQFPLLRLLKSYKSTRLFLLFSSGDGRWGVVDDYALSCIYGHLRGGQRDQFRDLDDPYAVVVDTEPMLPHPVYLLDEFVQHPGRQFAGSGVFADQGDE